MDEMDEMKLTGSSVRVERCGLPANAPRGRDRGDCVVGNGPCCRIGGL